ncbi:MAG: dihydroneopterin aldolase, partial [Gammaproteobacteria bacterium]|nr:dihydroneopterin aldolase [Gammaproteobacteria bacterium]
MITTQNQDVIFLTDLRVRTIIGINDWERRVRQTVAIDLEMPTDARLAAGSDAIDDTLNYKAVAKRLISFIGESRFQLVETLAERIASIVLKEFGAPWVRVHVHKPGAVRGANDVGVRIQRGDTGAGARRDVYVAVGSNIEPDTHL